MSKDDLRQQVTYAKSKLPLVSYREIAEVIGCHQQNIYRTYLNKINEQRCHVLLEAIEQVRKNRGEL